MPTSAQSRCLPATYAWEPGSSPTRIVPRPGTMPRSARALTRECSSSFMAVAVALPSRIVAVTASDPATRVQGVLVRRGVVLLCTLLSLTACGHEATDSPERPAVAESQGRQVDE